MLLRRNILERLLPLGFTSSSKRCNSRHLLRTLIDDGSSSLPSKKEPISIGFVEIFALLQRTTLTWAEVKCWYKHRRITAMRADQRFLTDRHEVLGPDLATAHFITFRGGKVKFKGQDKWFSKEHIENKEIPSNYYPHFKIEGVDASNTNICYEGVDNLVHLPFIKELILRNCVYVDDWFLNRLHIVEGSLQFLDLSGCPNVTERGICTLYKLRELKRLTLHDTPKISHKELVCLLLEEELPHCQIVGVNYDDPALLKRLEIYLDQV